MDIGTGKDDAKRSSIRHWLIDVCEPGEIMSAGRFARLAEETILRLQAEKKVPILVGGTGLYVRALLEGLDPLPERDEAVRGRLRRVFEEEGGPALHRRLREIDPEMAARVHPNDPARLIRFLEIHELSGRPPSQLFSKPMQAGLRFSTRTFWLRPEREMLRRKIADRVGNMLARGWVKEVEGLLRAGKDPRKLPNKPIGYAELTDVAEGRCALEEAQGRIVAKTRQYAKRQEIFFKGLLARPGFYQEGSSVQEIVPGA
jgi:tRNA dimethylallyltransferase